MEGRKWLEQKEYILTLHDPKETPAVPETKQPRWENLRCRWSKNRGRYSLKKHGKTKSKEKKKKYSKYRQLGHETGG
jgi:hypothetical protein